MPTENDELKDGSFVEKLSKEEQINLDISLNRVKTGVTKEKYSDAIRYCDWLNEKLDIHLLANRQEQVRRCDQKKHHPVRPRRGDVYLTQLGQNIGREINDKHLVVIMQNNKANLFSNTVVVIPISAVANFMMGMKRLKRLM